MVHKILRNRSSTYFITHRFHSVTKDTSKSSLSISIFLSRKHLLDLEGSVKVTIYILEKVSIFFLSHTTSYICSPSAFSSVQSLSHDQLFATPWTAACQAALSITNSWRLLKLMSIASVMKSSHLILCHPLLLPPSIFPSIRVFSKESVLNIRWPKYWSFSFSIRLSNEYPELTFFRIDWLDVLAVKGISRIFSNTTVQKHRFFGAQLSL